MIEIGAGADSRRLAIEISHAIRGEQLADDEKSFLVVASGVRGVDRGRRGVHRHDHPHSDRSRLRGRLT
jgi:hypothetical protein